MDAHEIEKAVLLPLESPEGASFYILTRDVLALAKRHPDRFIPFCCVDPRMAINGGKAGIKAVIHRYVDQGAKGFGEVKVAVPIDDPRMQVLYEICDDLRLCVLFHMDGIRCTDRAGLPGLEKMLRAYPNVNFVGHANGWWASISGDMTDGQMNAYPTHPVAPGGAADRLLTQYANMYADLSAGSGHNAIARDIAHGRLFLERHREKLFFATDYLTPGQEAPQFDLFASLDLAGDTWELISHRNARRLLNV
jgi:predicted TIM-barrel fold metal-dependent hydrolase